MVNLISCDVVSKTFGVRTVLDRVSLGVQRGDRAGVVGRNGDGKTTLLRIMAGVQAPDGGRVTHNRGLRVGLLSQHDDLDPTATVTHVVLGDRAEHEWATDPAARAVVEHLLAEVALDRSVGGLSGGERRRVSLAALLLSDVDVLLLDEPTNHLDIEAVAWLAEALLSRDLTFVVVTHDRWLLDAVCTTTWEVHDASVDSYDGGYAAYVLARAERQRQDVAAESRRLNLVRKELAWLRRGPPARSSKPRFRIDAARALIADEPAPRDTVALQRFAAARLGKDVLDLEDATIERGGRRLVDRATWRIGPGDRVGLIGVNGSGKTSVLSVLAGLVKPEAGWLRAGRTVDVALLSQELGDLDTTQRVLDSVEEISRVATVGPGREITATSMLERFGFTGDRLTARIGDLSGGERRRLQLLRLLLREPNVLLLDEPTNDLDIDTLTVVEDYLDGWPGTLVVVSHDRYFLERVCDTTWALLGDGSLVMLPGGVDEYLARRVAGSGLPAAARSRPSRQERSPYDGAGPADPSPAIRRAMKKELARLERQLARIQA
ncbi:MAG: ATP-binding cassette domain-containing protein, partial [Actinomycetota bacterium]|nr:ATP-binding cassette domain-containing protein [Actinomycetota bacterium]